MTDNVCADNRNELIAKYKTMLMESTNIEASPEEMAVIDNILFRFWQMGWLDTIKRAETWRDVLFGQILLIDKTSLLLDRGKDAYKALRKIHHDNCAYLEAAGLGEDYYKYMFEHYIKPDLEARKDG